MIEVKGLTKRYENKEALNGLNFQVNQGEIVAVVGLKGSGKSTLTDLLSGVMEPEEGQIAICGIDLAERASEARQQLGYVPAQPALYMDMTPRSCMKFLADARGLSSREAGEMITEAVRRFKLKDVADTTAKNLSEAVCRMVTLAQAAFTGAQVIVIDEPTQGMNPREILEMREAVKGLKADRAVLMTSENITEVCALADRVIVLSEGKIVSEGTPGELHCLTMQDGSVRVTVKGDEAAAKKALALSDAAVEVAAAAAGECTLIVTPADGRDLREEVFKAVCAANLTLLHMAPEGKPLDELLLSLVSERVSSAPEKGEQTDEGDL